MFFKKKKPISVRRSEGETDDDRRIQFRSLRSRRKKGDRPIGWLLMMLIAVGLLFWYLAQF